MAEVTQEGKRGELLHCTATKYTASLINLEISRMLRALEGAMGPVSEA